MMITGRWFELRGKLLFYFKKQGELKPTGFINIQGAKVEIDETKPMSFKLRGKNLARVYEISAENETEFQVWMKELNKAMNYNPSSDKEGLEEFKEEILKAKSLEQITIGNKSSDVKVSLNDFELLTGM